MTLSPGDWQKCSDYFDRQMDAAGRADFEARLRLEPALRENMEDLRRLRMALRSQPRIRVRKNFTLTPQLVGRKPTRSTWGMFQSLRLATVLASVMLVLVIAGDLLSNRMMQAPATSDMALTFQAANAPEAAVEGAVPAEPAPESRKAAPPPSEIEAEIVAQATPEISAMAKQAAPAGTTEAEMSLQMVAPTITPTAELAIEAFSLPVEGEMVEATPIIPAPEEFALQAFSLPEADETTSQPPMIQPAAAPEPQRSPLQAWRITEGLLLAIVIGAGLAAFLLRRR